MMRPRPQFPAAALRAGTLGGSLRPRVLGLAESLTGPSWLAILLEAGQARIGGEDVALEGPVLAWRPWRREARAVFAGGAAGSYVILGPSALAAAVGHMPESRDLREIAGRAVTVPMPAGGAFEAMRVAFGGIGRELAGDAPASHALVEAYLRVVLVEVFRAGRSPQADRRQASPSRRIFAQFGALVDAHFRERWSVEDYAVALGLSRDRLGDICRRVRGLGPKAVIDRRITLEARLQLENSSNSIQEIAALLGFVSAAQFNRFFRRTAGLPPGAFRAAALKGADEKDADRARHYEWP